MFERMFYTWEVRWRQLQLIEGEEAAPPLIGPGAVRRTFDTPEFAGLTFYEIQARSIVNTVPKSSRMPFRHTINPYRGCSHACVYCMSGDTLVLRADGRTTPLSQLRAGDQVIGTQRAGRRLRYVVTEVLDHWRTWKSAYRVVLADGTELIASGDHRFLTARGWKHVLDSAARPSCQGLQTHDKLLGVGKLAAAPKQTVEYRRGYVSGMVRADADFGVPDAPSRFRVARCGDAALGRCRQYLADFGVSTRALTDDDRPVHVVCAGSHEAVSAFECLVRRPREPSDDWQRGFLAAMFDTGDRDAAGFLGGDAVVAGWLQASLQALGFDTVVRSDPSAANPAACVVTVEGGAAQRLRLFHMIAPAEASGENIAGAAVQGSSGLRVVRVEPLGVDVPMFDVTTGSGDFIADGVVSHNCFARKTHEYLDLDSGADFDSKVIVKVNAAALLRKELAAPRWNGEHIAMGTNVDPYQRAEGRYRLMPGVIAALRDAANPFSVLTKGTMILRDVELLAQAAEVTSVGAAVSAGCLDVDLWRAVEPGTPRPSARLDACARLNAAGVECAVMIAPILPFLSDSTAQLRATVAACAQAGATSVTPIPLHLRPGAREWYLAWLGEYAPDLLPRYRELYAGGSYPAKSYQRRVTAEVKELAAAHGVGEGRARRVAPPAPRADEAWQPTLF